MQLVSFHSLFAAEVSLMIFVNLRQIISPIIKDFAAKLAILRLGFAKSAMDTIVMVASITFVGFNRTITAFNTVNFHSPVFIAIINPKFISATCLILIQALNIAVSHSSVEHIRASLVSLILKRKTVKFIHPNLEIFKVIDLKR